MVRLLKMPCVSSSVKLIGYSSLLAAAVAPAVLLLLFTLSLSVTCALCSQAVRSFM